MQIGNSATNRGTTPPRGPVSGTDSAIVGGMNTRNSESKIGLSTGLSTGLSVGQITRNPELKALLPRGSKSESTASSLFDSLRSALSNLPEAAKSVSSAARNAASEDRKNGVSLSDGAKQFSDTLATILQALSASEESSAKVVSEKTTAEGAVGEKKAVEGGSLFGLLGALKGVKNSEEALTKAGTYVQGALIQQLKKEGLSEFNELFDTNIKKVSGEEITGALLREGGAGGVADFFGLGEAKTKAAAGGVATKVAGEVAETASPFSRILGALGAGYSLYELVKNWGTSDPVSGAINGATAGAYLGSFLGAPGTLIGGAVGGLVGLASGFFKSSGKPQEQKERDAVRKILKETGFLTQNWQIKLANGELYDAGRDGKNTLVNIDGVTTRKMHEIDPSDPVAQEVSKLVKPLAQFATGADNRLMREYQGIFTNAALSNARSIEDAAANIQAMYQTMATVGQ